MKQKERLQRKIPVPTGREKISYSITDKGTEVLREWLKQPVEKDELRYETLLKLFFGNATGFDGAREHIERFEEKCRNLIEEWENK